MITSLATRPAVRTLASLLQDVTVSANIALARAEDTLAHGGSAADLMAEITHHLAQLADLRAL
jgi:hypothetical protein